MLKLYDSTTDDRVLIEALKDHRSEPAFALLYSRHTPDAYRLAYRVVGGHQQDAEDATQDAWVRAVGSLETWCPDRPFTPWFRTIALRAAIDVLRARYEWVDDIDQLPASETGAGDSVDLESAISALPPGYRAVLVLHDVEGFTHGEIARHLGITSGTSKGQLFKARRAVRARLRSAAEEPQ